MRREGKREREGGGEVGERETDRQRGRDTERTRKLDFTMTVD